MLVSVAFRGIASPRTCGGAARGEDGRFREEIYAVASTRDGDLELRLDLYLPRKGAAKGAVVLMHGGAFVGGSRDLAENRAYGEALATRGYVAAAISYRLHGDAPIVGGWASAYSRRILESDDPRLREAIARFGPELADAVAAAGVDLIAAVQWLREHASELGFEPNDIALFGASAGAITSLTAAYALDEYEGAELDVAAVVSLRGFLVRPTDAGNPIEKGDPPLLILHGEADRRVPVAEAESVFNLAKDAGLQVELYTVPGYGHELGAGRLFRMKLDRRRTVIDRLDAFLKGAFTEEDSIGSSLRGRLFDPDHGFDSHGAEREAESKGEHHVRQELESAVHELIRSVAVESDFVASLYGISKKRLLQHDFDDPERSDWSYWPRSRSGLPLRHMTAGQRRLTHRILSTLLSSKGYLQVNHIMMLEEFLAVVEDVGFARGAEEYTLTLFGFPSAREPWGLRFEGHHVSLNVTLSRAGISVTPSFLGAFPAPLSTGIRAGFNPLAYEQRYARALLGSLDDDQKAAAVLSNRPPSRLVTSQFQVDRAKWQQWRDGLSKDGVAASTFDASQKRTLRKLLGEIVGTYRQEVQGPWLESLDLNTLTFAWMGDTEIGLPHYFRIQGQDFVFELDAAQDGGSHVHTVWRDRAGDLGEDILGEHYRKHPHPDPGERR